jgi:ATP-dependent DNA helicase RecQ
MMNVSKEKIQAIKDTLKETFGFSQFRGEQEAVVLNTVAGNSSFVIMPTGAGKSLCYQLPALVMDGTAIVISPLIALMKNQMDQLSAFGVNAQVLNSSLGKVEINQVKKAVKAGEVKLLYIAPESLVKESNLEFLKEANISFVAIDEAHCISEWGHDFRPEYRKIRAIVEGLNKNLPILALTATATPKVQEDIQRNLNLMDAKLFKTSFNRKNLYYEIRAKRKDIDKQIIKYIKGHHGKAGIIYCLSRKKVEEISELLTVNNIKCLPYHAGLDNPVRQANQEAFLKEEVEVMVATIAFGMGIDKPDVRFVIHYDAPKSLEGYYQETGRAGRDGLEGNCIMFYDFDDIIKLDKFNKDKNVGDKESAKMLLNEIVGYSNLGLCRRRQLMSYFGEYYGTDCGQCDNCLKPTVRYKIEDEALLIIDTIKEIGEGHDPQHIADLIMGVDSLSVINAKHQKAKNFGKGKKFLVQNEDDDDDNDPEEDEDGNPIPAKPKAKKENPMSRPTDFWVSAIKQMAVLGYLQKDIDNYGLIRLSEKSDVFLKDSYPLTLSKDHDYEHDTEEEDLEKENAATGPAYDEALFELLKNLRKKIAKEKSLPPYVIFQDPSLEEMATTYPATKEDLANINGVGMGKVVKFGKPFLDLITKYLEENDIETATEVVVKSAVNKSKIKIYIIQQIDRKIELEEIAESKNLSIDDLLNEIESICFSGTKLHLDYYINQVIEPDKQEEIYEYFMTSESDSIAEALNNSDIDDITIEELRLMRIKFLSEMAN